MGSQPQCLALHQTNSKHLYNNHFVQQARFKAREEKTTPFGVNLMGSHVLCWAAQQFKATLYAACADEGPVGIKSPVQRTWSHTPVSCSADKPLCVFLI